MSVKYGCEISLSLDKAAAELDRLGVKYRVESECELSFRQKPTLEVKKILRRCGFERSSVQELREFSADSVRALQDKFS